MYNAPMVPDGFEVPEILETDRMRLRGLTVDDAVKDYEAVMETEAYLKTVYDPGGQWPTGLTLAQNIIELGWHQVEFQLRTSFAYTVVALDESRVLGCMYIYPTAKPGYDAKVTMWVRRSMQEKSRRDGGLDEHLFETVRAWIGEVWPFENPGYPGRTISYEEWRAAPSD